MIEEELAILKEQLAESNVKIEMLDFERKRLLVEYLNSRARRSQVLAAFWSKKKQELEKEYASRLDRQNFFIGKQLSETKLRAKKLEKMIEVRQQKLKSGLSPEEQEREELEAKLRRRRKRGHSLRR